jgi:hypothetical protein
MWSRRGPRSCCMGIQCPNNDLTSEMGRDADGLSQELSETQRCFSLVAETAGFSSGMNGNERRANNKT